MAEYIDFKNYLQEKLDGIQKGFNVTNERKLKANFIDKEVVITALAGVPRDDSFTAPYQITITTLDPENVVNVFTKLAKENNDKSFENIIQEGQVAKIYSIIPVFQTPVVMDADLEFGNNHYSRLVAFANLTVWYDVSNVKSIKIDNNEIKFLNGTFGYTAELVSNRVSGDRLNKSTKKSATSMLTFQIVNRDCEFTRDIFQIMTGQKDGMTGFQVEIELTNGQTATMTMILGTNTLSFARSMLSSDNIALYLKDDR